MKLYFEGSPSFTNYMFLTFTTRYVCETRMPPAATKSKLAIFIFKYKGHSQGHKVIGLGVTVTWMGFLANYEVSISYCSKVKVKVKSFFATDTKTGGQKQYASKFHSGMRP